MLGRRRVLDSLQGRKCGAGQGELSSSQKCGVSCMAFPLVSPLPVNGNAERPATPSAKNATPKETIMSTILSYKGTVYPWHCDHMGHMNVMWYVGKIRRGDMASLRPARPSRPPSCAKAGRAWRRCSRTCFAYKRELMAGDIVEIESRILEIREKVIRFQHDDAAMPPAATSRQAAEITAVHMDRQLRKSCALPGSDPRRGPRASALGSGIVRKLLRS